MFYVSRAVLSKDDINRIAHLSRIKITEDEEKEFSKDLSSILDFVSKLKEAEGNVSDEQLRECKDYSILREDSYDNKELEGAGDILIDMALEKKDGYVKVKRVL